MGSMNNPNSWAPYWNYKDCSQGICSFYCPQWCYIIFTPPPPVEPSDHNSNFNFSPLIVAVIGILATSFLLLSYYIAILKCRRRRGDQNPSPELDSNHNQINHDTRQVASTGLDESLIKSIAVCKYKRGDELVEGTECAVCLSEFQEDESLRLLPKCSHAFHLPCIDTWLKSHSNCPLCRCNVSFSNPLPSQAPISQPGPTTRDLFSLETQHQNEVTLVVDDHPETDHQEEVVGSLVSNANEYPFQAGGNTLIQNSQPRDSITDVGQECFQQLRRSISMGSFACQSHLLVADILHIYKDGEDLGSFTCDGKADDGNRVIKRSVSTGRFTVTMHEKGKSCIIPN